MPLNRRRFTREFKLRILAEISSGKTISQAAREYEIHPITISRWRKEHSQYKQDAFSGNGVTYKEEARIAELERMVGQLTMENALLKKTLQQLGMQAPERASGRKRFSR